MLSDQEKAWRSQHEAVRAAFRPPRIFLKSARSNAVVTPSGVAFTREDNA